MGRSAHVRRSRNRASAARRTDVSARPLLIGGMHRSGTSLTASLFAAAGLDIGLQLLGANDSNPLGHFEDLGFFYFHRRALHAQGICLEGYTASERARVPIPLETEARELLAARIRPGVAWGWKEPRTTLFLDFWQQRLPDARHVFVFRRPWEVADSLFRRGDEPFVDNPTFALAVWTHYNRLIIDFVRRHPAHCLVFEITQVIADPERLFEAVRSRFGMPLGTPALHYREELFTTDRDSIHETMVREAAPGAWRTYLELRELAGAAAPANAAARRDISPGECAVIEWARAAQAGVEARESRLRADHEARRRAEVEARLRVEQEARLAAEQEARLAAEQEARLRAEQEARLRVQPEAREDAAGNAFRRPLALIKRGIRRAASVVLRPIELTWRRIRTARRTVAPAPSVVLRACPPAESPPSAKQAA